MGTVLALAVKVVPSLVVCEEVFGVDILGMASIVTLFPWARESYFGGLDTALQPELRPANTMQKPDVKSNLFIAISF